MNIPLTEIVIFKATKVRSLMMSDKTKIYCHCYLIDTGHRQIVRKGRLNWFEKSW